MLKGLLIFALATSQGLSAEKIVPCPQIDKTKLDTDGMPFCPAVVTETSAFGVFRCAFNQARTWHEATQEEKTAQATLLGSFIDARAKGNTKAGTAEFLQAADDLGLQACRVKDKDDSYRLVYTKPGVKDYNGTFFMLRETKASKVILMVPHDGSDGTHTDTKLAFQRSKAVVLYSNGYPKSIDLGKSDFIDHTNTMGAVATRQLDDLLPKSVWLMIHGQANSKSVLYRSRSKVLGRAFTKGVLENTNIKIIHDNFNAGYAVDKLINSTFYLKTEIPARIHQGNLGAMAKIVIEIEKNAWAWEDITVPDDVPNQLPELPATPETDLPPDTELLENEQGDCEANGKDTPGIDIQDDVITAPSTPKYKMPPQKINTGLKKLLCIGVEYIDIKRVVDRIECANLTKKISSFYERNSRNLIEITTVNLDPYKSGLKGSKNAYEKSVRDIQAKYPKYDYYIVPGIYTHPHAGGGVARVPTAQMMTGTHEVGHLVGLAHAGAYNYKGEIPYLDQYGDQLSVMGNVWSNFITAPQYYYLGWIPKDEVVVYDPKGANSYDLKRTSDFYTIGLEAVIIPPSMIPSGSERYLFVSAVECEKKTCAAVHFTTGGGSQKIMQVGEEKVDTYFTGLKVNVTQLPDNKINVKLSFEPIQK